MKKLSLLTAAILTIGLLQTSCSSSTGNTTTDTTTTPADTSKMGGTTKTEGGTDTAFAGKAAVGGLAEVILGKLALSKSTDAKIKEFAGMMIKDHGKANGELAGIAKKKSITLPATLDAEHQAKSDSLSKLSGAVFDKAYAATMVEGHKKTLALMQTEASGGADADLKAFAGKTAPVVQTHLDMINKINAGFK